MLPSEESAGMICSAGSKPKKTGETEMTIALETSIKTTDGIAVSVSEWDNGGAWFSMMHRHGSIYTSLTRHEAEQLLAGLQEILAKKAL
jgi:hypothetical protein